MALTGLTKVQKVGINTATIPTVGGVEGVFFTSFVLQ